MYTYTPLKISTSIKVLQFLTVLTFFFIGNSFLQAQNNIKERPNVIFISIDDLRPDLGCYGKKDILTPYMDKLAEEAVLFKNHFVQVPTCGASRYSMLTGQFPTTTTHLKNAACEIFISEKPASSIPETFIHELRNNGYYTVGIGKISHSADGYVYGYEEPVSTTLELPNSWDQMLFDSGKWGTGWNAFFGYADGSNRQGRNKMVKPYEKPLGDKVKYPDDNTARLAVSQLKKLKKMNQPFFLGIGFFKPHLPFNAPKEYWDLYDRDQIKLANNPNKPLHVNDLSLHNSNEFGSYKLGDEHPSLATPLSDDYARKLRHGYYASVSYIDAQVGKVLKAVERLHLSENTIIVVWGDHGWHLGNQQMWGKHSLFEVALRSAFIIKVPGEKFKGASVDRIVSSVDIYPTLMELCGIESDVKTDGYSLVSIMKNHNSKDWKDLSFGYFNNGITMRTPRYRLTKYFRDQTPTIELYDHKNDPSETVNIAADHPDIVTELLFLLEKGSFNIYK